MDRNFDVMTRYGKMAMSSQCKESILAYCIIEVSSKYSLCMQDSFASPSVAYFTAGVALLGIVIAHGI